MMGVYTITNARNGKVYVGGSVDIEKRWSVHKAHLRHGRHVNKHLQAAWNKYGEDAFEWRVVEETESIDCITGYEQYWLDCLLMSPNTCYNIASNAESPNRGQPMSEEQKAKISASLTGRKKHFTIAKELPPWLAGYWKGRHLTEEHKCNIGDALRGKRLGPISKEHKQKISKAVAKPYPAFINRDTGEIIPAGVNLSKMCKEHRLNRSNMWCVVHGRYAHHQGWILASDLEE